MIFLVFTCPNKIIHHLFLCIEKKVVTNDCYHQNIFFNSLSLIFAVAFEVKETCKYDTLGKRREK